MDKQDTRHTSVDVRDFINAIPVSRFQIMISAMCFLIVALDGFDIAIIGFVAPHIRAEWQLSMVSLGPCSAPDCWD